MLLDELQIEETSREREKKKKKKERKKEYHGMDRFSFSVFELHSSGNEEIGKHFWHFFPDSWFCLL